MSELFVYGTLMEKPVQQALLGRVPLASPYCLPGYRVVECEDRYFNLVPDPDGSAPGIVMDLFDMELVICDHWEQGYVRKSINGIYFYLRPDYAGHTKRPILGTASGYSLEEVEAQVRRYING